MPWLIQPPLCALWMQRLRPAVLLLTHKHGPQPITNLRDFFEINLELARPGSPISLVQADEAIESRGHMAPPSTIHQCDITDTLIGEGTVLRVGAALKPH